MAVGIESDNHSRMPQHLLDDLRVDVPAEKQRRACVPEIVESDLRECCPFRETAQVPVADVRWIQRGAAVRREDESLILVQIA